MPAQIVVDQAGKPPGVAGRAREDLVLGTQVVLSAAGGPFLAHQWSIIHRPIDIVAGVRATSILATPTAATSNLLPIDVRGTYHLQLVVDSGSGLGALSGDTARITFYAGPTLAASPDSLPRRIPAFQETIEHNVPDAIQPAGNTEGWSRELYRWFAVIASLEQASGGADVAAGRVTLTGGGATIVRSTGVSAATRLVQGRVQITFTVPFPDTDYAPSANALGLGGQASCTSLLTTGFIVERADAAGSLTDADFNFAVKLRV